MDNKHGQTPTAAGPAGRAPGWHEVAAGTAVVVVGTVVAVEAVVDADAEATVTVRYAERSELQNSELTMTTNELYLLIRRLSVVVLMTLALALPTARLATAADPEQRSFAAPEEAVQALAAATKIHDTEAVLSVLGKDALPLISSGDPVADEKARERFLQSYEAVNELVKRDDGETFLEIGDDDWEFPIPLVETESGWRFDAAAGNEEVLDRRIGANELDAIQSCLAYVDAQFEYYERDPEKTDLLQYAQKITSTPGKRDGLYWEAPPDEEESPLGPHFAGAQAEGYDLDSGKAAPYLGYYFRILTAQGPAAPGGAYDYRAHGHMIGGFALIAFPAKWDNSGVMTFIVNQDGVVYQTDLGPDTAAAAKAINTFNPDDTWKSVEPESDDAETDS